MRREAPDGPAVTARVDAYLRLAAQVANAHAPDTDPRWDQLDRLWEAMTGTEHAFLDGGGGT